jgi:hypothetical protein
MNEAMIDGSVFATIFPVSERLSVKTSVIPVTGSAFESLVGEPEVVAVNSQSHRNLAR